MIVSCGTLSFPGNRGDRCWEANRLLYTSYFPISFKNDVYVLTKYNLVFDDVIALKNDN